MEQAFEAKIHSTGVHYTNRRCLIVYCKEDDFICPNYDRPKGTAVHVNTCTLQNCFEGNA